MYLQYVVYVYLLSFVIEKNVKDLEEAQCLHLPRYISHKESIDITIIILYTLYAYVCLHISNSKKLSFDAMCKSVIEIPGKKPDPYTSYLWIHVFIACPLWGKMFEYIIYIFPNCQSKNSGTCLFTVQPFYPRRENGLSKNDTMPASITQIVTTCILLLSCGS